MEAATDDARETVLPSNLQQLAAQFEGDEFLCMKLIRRCKELLVALRSAGEAENTSLAELRGNLADRHGGQLKDVIRQFMAVQGAYRQDSQEKARRQLLIAFPSAAEEEVQEALMCPAWAAAAVAQRVDLGAACPPLSSVLEELKQGGNFQLVEEGAQGLKMLFFQFAELVEEQDVVLGEIEENIQNTLKQTEDAVEILREAKGHKSTADSTRCKCFMFLALLLVICGVFFLHPQFASMPQPLSPSSPTRAPQAPLPHKLPSAPAESLLEAKTASLPSERPRWRRQKHLSLDAGS